MDRPQRLLDYPWIVVRVGCIYCRRRGTYRLARLAAKYGADISMDHLRRLLAGDCPWIDVQPRKYTATCGCHFPDLDRFNPPPPDLPPFMGKPRLVSDNPDIPRRRLREDVRVDQDDEDDQEAG